MKKILNIVLVCFLIIACGDKKEALVETNLRPIVFSPSDLIVTILKDSVDADGFKTNEIYVKVSPALLAEHSTVKFETAPNGKFSNGSTIFQTSLDISGEAKAFVNSIATGNIIVKATVGGLTKQVSLNFDISYPDQVSVECDSVFFTALPGTKMGVNAKLFRINGQISSGQMVNFRDSTEDNRSIGIFLNNTVATSNGIATSSYWIQDTSYHGYLYIIGSMAIKNGFISGRSRVKIR